MSQNPNAAVDKNRYYKSVNDRLFFYIFSADKQLVRFERASFRLEQFVIEVIESGNVGEGEIEVFQHTNETGQLSTVMMTALYSGLRKANYAQVVLGFIAVLIGSAIGYYMAERALVPLKEAYENQKQSIPF